MKEQKLRKVTRCFLIAALGVSMIANIISAYCQYTVAKFFETKFQNELTGTDILAEESENSIMSITFYGEKEINKTEKDFFASEKEALEKPFEVILSGGGMRALVQCDEGIELTLDYMKNSTEEKQWLVKVESYVDAPLFETISIPKMSEEGMYLVHANYDGMDKYRLFDR